MLVKLSRCSLLRLPLLSIALLVGGIVSQAETVPAVNADEQASPIAIIPQDGFNLQVVDQLSPTYVVVKLNSPAHNWFAGTFTNLPTDREVTIGLSMQDNDTKGNKADVSKWQGLVPVMTYADPMKYETYEWFQQDDQGRWVSGDPLKTGKEKWAGTGTTPIQSVMPADLAEQFLSANGKYWQAWREIDSAETVANLNIFRIKQRFSLSTVTIAMRVPFSYTFQQALISRLLAAKLPGVYVDKLSGTPERRRLQVIRLEDPESQIPLKNRKTVLLTAREHATEPASSWVVYGALSQLLSGTPTAKRLRKDMTWLLIPLQDPDGAANGLFDRLTDRFYTSDTQDTPLEIILYARYFTEYVAAGRTIDIAVSLHNVEANECMNVFAPQIDPRCKAQVIDFNRAFFSELTQQGYAVHAPEETWGEGFTPFRLYGWCALHFGTIDLCYEVNDRYPTCRLSLPELQAVGSVLASQLSAWQQSPTGENRHHIATQHISKHLLRRAEYFINCGYPPSRRTAYDMLELGY